MSLKWKHKDKSILFGLLSTKWKKKGLDAAANYALRTFQKINPWDTIKDLATKHGVAGIAIGVTEVASSFIVPMAHSLVGIPPGLSIILGQIPTSIITLPGYLYYANKKKRKILSEKLGITNLDELEEFRRQLLGLDIRDHIATTIVNELKERPEIQIIRAKRSFLRKKLPFNTISIDQLESIIKSTYSSEFLQKITSLSKNNDHMYTHLLLYFINHRPSALEKFLYLSKEAIKGLDDNTPFSEVRHLNEVQFNLDFMAKNKRSISRLRASLEKGHSQTNIVHLKNRLESTLKILENMFLEMNILELELRKHELTLLSFLKAGNNIEDYPLYESYQKLRHSFKNLYIGIGKVNDLIKDPHPERSLQKLRLFNSSLAETYSTPDPFHTFTNRSSDCLLLLRTIL